MADEIKIKDLDEAVEAISTAGYMLGILSAREQIAASLKRESGELFANGHDKVARSMRVRSRSMSLAALTERETYDQEHKPREDAAIKWIEAEFERLGGNNE